MAGDEVANFEALLATATRERPLRTYSHKGRSSRAASLPALKPTTTQLTPTNPNHKLQRFRIGHADGLEERQQWGSPIEQPESVQAQPVDACGDHVHQRPPKETSTHAEGRTERLTSHSAADLEEESARPSSVLVGKIEIRLTPGDLSYFTSITTQPL
ncbi:hypothetical protein VTK56DRAFT_270 [Thermocarpiscus australiensis]